jgi:hypothetical protein
MPPRTLPIGPANGDSIAWSLPHLIDKTLRITGPQDQEERTVCHTHKELTK